MQILHSHDAAPFPAGSIRLSEEGFMEGNGRRKRRFGFSGEAFHKYRTVAEDEDFCAGP